jgi:two-component system response regulator MprA
MRVLVVEDEKKMAELLKRGLEEENHCVTVALDGREGFEVAASGEFDVIVLDLMLPGIDGFEVARRLRRADNRTPILMLTARDALQDIANGLDFGADDYLTKPFAFTELLARLRSVTRRGATPRSLRLQVADLVLDPATRQVFRGEREVRLTATEFRLLEFLMRRAGRVIPRDLLLEAVWRIPGEVEGNTLDAFMSLLRNKIEDESSHRLIHTVRGIGYCMRGE